MTNPLTTEQVAAIAQAVAIAVSQTLAAAPEAPVTEVEPEVCGARTKAGTPCQLKAGRCPHHKGGAKVAPKAAPKAERKATLLRKATRKAFVKAAAKEFGVDWVGLSTRQVAEKALAESRIPAGFDIGAGYRELVS